MQKLKLTKKYETYSEHKKSDVQWLGQIPSTWNVGKVKQIFNLSKKKVHKIEGLNILSLTQQGIKIRDISNNEGQIAATYEGYKKVELGDIVLNPMDLLSGFVDSAKTDGIISPAYSVLSKKDEKTNSQFYDYYFRKHYLERIFFPHGVGVSVDHRWTLRDDVLMNFPLIELSQQEQDKAVEYLDEKTALIDKIIEKKKKQIELLHEERAAVINNLVVNVKGSVEKLKYLSPQRSTKLTTTLDRLKYIGLEHVQSMTGRLNDGVTAVEPESSVNVFKSGDILFGKLRPYLAKVIVPDFDGVSSGEFLVLMPDKTKIYSKFLFYRLICSSFIKSVNDSTYGTKMPRANWQFIGNQAITFPKISEQKRISVFLDEQTSKSDRTVLLIHNSIRLLEEFKSSLISNVVTGKVKV